MEQGDRTLGHPPPACDVADRRGESKQQEQYGLLYSRKEERRHEKGGQSHHNRAGPSLQLSLQWGFRNHRSHF